MKKFTKSFLFTREFQSKIRKARHLLKIEFEVVEIPKKLTKFIEAVQMENEKQRKLNRILTTSEKRDEIDHQTSTDRSLNYYRKLEFDKKSLIEYADNDEFKLNWLKRQLKKLKDDPLYKNGRWYHVFHRLPKDCRETVLRLDGEKIKEIFDVAGSDLHMLAKHLEKKNIPVRELVAFQRDVMNDFRKKFGQRKRDGKCKAVVKRAFKIYLNSRRDFYSSIRRGSMCSKIDEYFAEKYPTIREYIVNREAMWKDVMNMEFSVISKKMFKMLQRRGIEALTCHDAIYVKQSVEVEDIEEMFNECLGMCTYRQDMLDSI